MNGEGFRNGHVTALRMRAAALWQFLNGTEGELGTRVLRSGAWVAAASAGIRAVEFVRSIILARLLMPEVFGLMGIASFVTQGLEAVTQTGQGAALLHRQEKLDEAYDTAWVIGIIRGLILAILVALAAPLVADFYERPVLKDILRVTALLPFIWGFQNINMVRFRRDLNFKQLAIFQQVTVLVGVIVAVSLAFWLRNVWALVIGGVMSAALTVGLSFVIQHHWPRFRFRGHIARELYHYGKFMTGLGVVVFLALQMDNAVVGKLLGMEALGFYAVAYTLANMPATHISSLVSNVMLPSYSQIQADRDRLYRVYLKVLRATATMTVPAAAGLAFLAPDIVRIIYGQKWLPMVGTLRVLCIHGLLRSIQMTSSPFFQAIGRPRYDFYVNLLRVMIIALAIVPLSQRWGIVGTSMSVCLAICVSFLVAFYLVTTFIGISWGAFLAQLRPAVLGSALMLVGLHWLRAAFEAIGPLQLLALVVLGVVMYGASLLALDRRSLAEILKHTKNYEN